MNFLGSLDFKEMLRQRDNQIFLGLIITFAVGFGGFYGYRWYRSGIQKTAQKTFSEAMEVYNQALYFEMNEKKDSKDKQHMWDEVEIAFKTGYLQNKSSTLAPFFLAFQSFAEHKLGKIDQSYATLNEAVSMLSKSSPYYYLYSVKQALVEFDKKDFEKAVNHLNQLIQDKNNTLKDMAAFYLGEYYWSINNIDKAKEQFQIAEAFNTESSWSNLAKQRLLKIG